MSSPRKHETQAQVSSNFHGKSFHDRLRAFLDHVRKTHSLHIRVVGNLRTPEAAQKMHICHMFLHNAFAHKQPAPEAVSKTRTISWEHFSDPRVKWKGVSYRDVLRTKSNESPEKAGERWVRGKEPDHDTTTLRAKALMREAGYVETAMIACGISPCGEPCGCAVGVSHHISGNAADLNTDDLSTLTAKLGPAKQGSHHLPIDDLFAAYGLYRPMLHHQNSPEPWHIEATQDHSYITHKHHAAHHHSHHQHLQSTDILQQCPNPRGTKSR